MTEPAQPEPPVTGGPDAAEDHPGGRVRHRNSAFIVPLGFVAIAMFAGVALWVGMFAWFEYDYLFVKVEPTPFSSTEWKKLSANWMTSESRKRQYMAEDLLANHHLENMSRAGILELLGPPDPEARFSRDSAPYIFSYKLGPQAFVDDFWLVIQFDVEDLVIDASIRGD